MSDLLYSQGSKKNKQQNRMLSISTSFMWMWQQILIYTQQHKLTYFISMQNVSLCEHTSETFLCESQLQQVDNNDYMIDLN